METTDDIRGRPARAAMPAAPFWLVPRYLTRLRMLRLSGSPTHRSMRVETVARLKGSGIGRHFGPPEIFTSRLLGTRV